MELLHIPCVNNQCDPLCELIASAFYRCARGSWCNVASTLCKQSVNSIKGQKSCSGVREANELLDIQVGRYENKGDTDIDIHIGCCERRYRY